MMSHEQLGRGLLGAHWPIKFMVWLGLIPVIFLIEFSLYKALVKGRNLKGIAAMDLWAAKIQFQFVLIGFARLTAEILEGPR